MDVFRFCERAGTNYLVLSQRLRVANLQSHHVFDRFFHPS